MKNFVKALSLILTTLTLYSGALAAAPSGTCGMLMVRHYWGLENKLEIGGTKEATHSGLMYVDFDNGNIKYSRVLAKNYGDPLAVTEERYVELWTSIQAHSHVPNTYKMSLFTDLAKTRDVGYFNVMHVNSESTYLIQFVATNISNGNSSFGTGAGVCQRF